MTPVERPYRHTCAIWLLGRSACPMAARHRVSTAISSGHFFQRGRFPPLGDTALVRYPVVLGKPSDVTECGRLQSRCLSRCAFSMMVAVISSIESAVVSSVWIRFVR